MVYHYLGSHRRLGLYRASVTHILAALVASIPTTLAIAAAANQMGNRCLMATSLFFYLKI